MPFVVGGAILGGALISGIASGSAANTQAGAAQAAANLQAQQYQQTRTDLAPWMQQGQQALGAIGQYTGVGPGGTFNPNAPGVAPFDLSKFQASPAYQFNLQQGQLALDKAANARGNYYAPQTLQDVSRFSQGLASNEFLNAYNMYNQQQGNVFNRLNTLSGAGQNAAVGLGGFGSGAAGNIGLANMGAANAQAAGTMGISNALGGGLQNAYSAYQGNQNLQQLNQIIASLQGGTPTANSAASMPGGDYMTQLGYTPVYGF